MKISEVMSKECNWIPPETTLDEAAMLMKKNDVGFLPIGENDRLIGTVTDRDLVIRALAEEKDPSKEMVRNIMTPKVLYCYDDQDVNEICTNMAETRVRRLPVVNRDKRLVGIVSLGDLSQSVSQESGEALKNITKCNDSVSKAA